MHISEINKKILEIDPQWTIVWNEFCGIDPKDVDSIEGVPDGETVWHCFFQDTLLQIDNREARLLLDVGWYPAYDPAGIYVARLMHYEKHPDGSSVAEWDSPIAELETLDPDKLVRFVERVCR